MVKRDIELKNKEFECEIDLKLEPLRALEFFKTGTFEGLSNVKLDRLCQIEFSENLNC